MNKGISTPIALTIIVILALLVAMIAIIFPRDIDIQETSVLISQGGDSQECNSDSKCQLVFSNCDCKNVCLSSSEIINDDCEQICDQKDLSVQECKCENNECVADVKVLSDKEVPNKDLCQNTESGWSCSWGEDDPPPENYGVRGEEFKDYCLGQGGSWICYGFCMPEYERFCDFPFEDQGKECSNSSECQGGCKAYVEGEESMDIASNNYSKLIQKDCSDGECKGQCSPYPKRFCDFWYEIENNKVVPHMILCD